MVFFPKMRVIAGKFRSRTLHSIRGLDIRPTSDRLRETLFDVLTAANPDALAGSVWIDLFAGTGAVGIEAISRGAATAYFVESSRRARQLIDVNLKSLGVSHGYEVLEKHSLQAIAELEGREIRADFIFVDPPYRLREAYRKVLEKLADSDLSRHALVIAEHEKRFDPGSGFGLFERTRKLEQGDAVLSFYRKA